MPRRIEGNDMTHGASKACPVFTRAQACSARHTSTLVGTAGVFRGPCRRYVFSAAERVEPARSLSHRREAGRRAVGLSRERPWQSPVGRVWSFRVLTQKRAAGVYETDLLSVNLGRSLGADRQRY